MRRAWQCVLYYQQSKHTTMLKLNGWTLNSSLWGPLIAAFRSPLMKALNRGVETLGLWIVTSSVTFIKSVNQSHIKPCLIVHLVAMWTWIYFIWELSQITGLIQPYDLNLTKADLVDLLSVANKKQLFQFIGALCKQTDGVAMGSPLGPFLANVFMSHMEENLEREGKLSSFYQRYVCNTCTIMPNIATASNFLDMP